MLKLQAATAAPLDLLFGALSDPSRRAMVERLTRGPASVSQLAEPLDMSLPAVVQHLQVLEASGLITSTKLGRVRTCQIVPSALRAVEGWVSRQRTEAEHALDRLGDYLLSTAEELPLMDPTTTEESNAHE